MAPQRHRGCCLARTVASDRPAILDRSLMRFLTHFHSEWSTSVWSRATATGSNIPNTLARPAVQNKVPDQTIQLGFGSSWSQCTTHAEGASGGGNEPRGSGDYGR